MKIIGYAVTSKNGFERCENEIEQRKRMKELHRQNIQPVPLVLVEGLPGEIKSKWQELNRYKKLKKEGETNG